MTQLEQKIYDVLIAPVEYSDAAATHVQESWDKFDDELKSVYRSKAIEVAKLIDTWIPVGEKLPAVYEMVSVVIRYKDYKPCIYTGYVDEYGGFHFGEHGEHIGPERVATHWRPLPELPKNEA
jgi:hypothetical protein